MPIVIEPPPAESSSPNVEDPNQPSDELRSQAAHAYDIILTEPCSAAICCRRKSDRRLRKRCRISTTSVRACLSVWHWPYSPRKG